MTALLADANPRIFEGANNPPEPTPWEAVKVNLDDLLLEARNWADGKVAETQPQADEISRLMEDIQRGLDAADTARLDEKKPYDDKINEIQARYNVYVAPLKNKIPGKGPLAISALKASLAPYLKKLEDEKRAAADAARKAAEDAANAAAEAMRKADASNLEAREAAEELVEAARLAGTAAKRAENDKAHALGGSRAKGLRSVWTAHMTDRKAALFHYLVQQPDAVVALLQKLADADVFAGKRTIPGFDVKEERVL